MLLKLFETILKDVSNR